jgi:hypothetical protein
MAFFNLKAQQFDVNNAFLYAELEDDYEPIYTKFPPEFAKPKIVARFRRTLYGMRNSPFL